MRPLPRTRIGISALLILGGCIPVGQDASDNLMENPLYAKRYYDELAENLVSLSIHNDPLLQEKGKEKKVERARHDALTNAQEAERRQRSGTQGAFIPIEEYARGRALLIGNNLYLSTDFEVLPGLSLHLFLTTVVDPRDGVFPDPDAVDIGPLKNMYGAQEFPIQLPKDPILYRTLVLWDTTLERLVSFAQLSK